MREPQKSFGHQETFATDLTDEEYVEAVLRRMADNLFATVREEGRSIRTLTVKVRYNDMGEDQASESLLEPTDLETDVYGLLHTLYRKAWKRRVSLRLVSLKLSNLYHGCLLTELPLLPPSNGTTQTRAWPLKWMRLEKLTAMRSSCADMIFASALLRWMRSGKVPPQRAVAITPQLFSKAAGAFDLCAASDAQPLFISRFDAFTGGDCEAGETAQPARSCPD